MSPSALGSQPSMPLVSTELLPPCQGTRGKWVALAGLCNAPVTAEQCSLFDMVKMAWVGLGQPGTQGALVPDLHYSGGGSAGDCADSRTGDPGACHRPLVSICLGCANSPEAGPCHTTRSYPSGHGMEWSSSLPLAQPQKCQLKVNRLSLWSLPAALLPPPLRAPLTTVPSFPVVPSCH